MCIRNSVFWSVFWLGLLGVGACAGIDEIKTYSKKGLTVSFPRLINISDPNQEEYSGGIDTYQIDHPVNISTEQVHNHLLSLWYKNIDPPGKPQPVFSMEEAAELSPLFKAALNKVDPAQYIHFEYHTPGGVTEGEVFASVESIHWRFNRIRDVYFMKAFLGSGRETWKLVRRIRQQRFHVEKTGLVKLTRENWMLVDKDLLPQKRRSPSAAEAEPAPPSVSPSPPKFQKPPDSPDPELKKKLQTLKDLLDQGLINENDYRMKKEELLNQHL